MLTSTTDDAKLLRSRTDCVSFIASPSTCSKGSHCEFRHNEAARFNPKNCWYWNAGGCANFHCKFRHPPLDGHLTATTTVKRHELLCFYFCQGYCAKGQKCAYKHGEAVQSASSPMLAEVSQEPFVIHECKDSNENSKRCSELDLEHENKGKQADDQPDELKCEALVGDANVSTSAKTSLRIELQEKKAADAPSRMLGTADTCSGTLRRSGSHESAAGTSSKLEQCAATDENTSSSNMHTVKDISKRPASFEEDQEAYPTVQRLQHKSAASPEIRQDDCTEPEEICEVSCFNTILDVVKPGQLAHADCPPSSASRLRDVGKDCSQKHVVHQDQEFSHAKHIQQRGEDTDSNYQCLERSSHVSAKYTSYADPLYAGCAVTLKAPQNEQEMNVLRAKQPIYTDQDLRFHIIKNRKAALQETLNEMEEVFQRQKLYGCLRRNGLQNHHTHQPALDMHLKQQEIVGDCVACNGGQVHSGQRCIARSKQNAAHCRPEFQRECDTTGNGAQMANYRGGYIFKRLRHIENSFEYDLDCNESMGNRPHFQPAAPLPWQPILRSCMSTAPHPALVTSPDFEGPKPLSVLLEEKRRRLAISKGDEANYAGAKFASVIQTDQRVRFRKNSRKTLGISDSPGIADEFGCSKPDCLVPMTERQEVTEIHDPKADVEHRKPLISADALHEVRASCSGEDIDDTAQPREAPNETATKDAAISAVNTELSLSSLSYSAGQDHGSPSVDDCTLNG